MIALADSEHRARPLFEQAPVGIVQLNQELRIIAANRRFCEITRMEPDALVGMTPASCLGGEDPEAVAAAFAELLRGEWELISAEHFATVGDGRQRWLGWTACYVQASGGEYLAAHPGKA